MRRSVLLLSVLSLGILSFASANEDAPADDNGDTVIVTGKRLQKASPEGGSGGSWVSVGSGLPSGVRVRSGSGGAVTVRPNPDGRVTFTSPGGDIEVTWQTTIEIDGKKFNATRIIRCTCESFTTPLTREP